MASAAITVLHSEAKAAASSVWVKPVCRQGAQAVCPAGNIRVAQQQQVL